LINEVLLDVWFRKTISWFHNQKPSIKYHSAQTDITDLSAPLNRLKMLKRPVQNLDVPTIMSKGHIL